MRRAGKRATGKHRGVGIPPFVGFDGHDNLLMSFLMVYRSSVVQEAFRRSALDLSCFDGI